MDSSLSTTIESLNGGVQYEHDLARQWSVPKPILARFRDQCLEEGRDWCRSPSKGIALSSEAVKKMSAALAVPADPAAEIDVEVAGVLGTRHVRGRLADGRMVKVLVESRPGGGMAPTSTLQPRQTLGGCRWLNAELLAYAGPLPRRRGLPLPVHTAEKKEARP